jgi:hypothetical protein
MRPTTIVYFERLVFATLALGILQSSLRWNNLTKMVGLDRVLLIQGLNLAIVALLTLLTLLISRRRSKIAMWISIAMFSIGLPMFFVIVAKGLLFGSGLISGLISAIQVVAQVTAYSLLFTPSARSWMNDKPLAA